jgi:hypothetical protein
LDCGGTLIDPDKPFGKSSGIMARIIRPNFQRGPWNRPQRYRRRRNWLSDYQVRKLLFILAVLAVLWAVFYVQERWDGAEHSSPLSAQIAVVDGDTVRNNGQSYRLVGFNTPESGRRAGCREERALSAKATDRLEQLVSEGNVDLRRVACACPPGTEGTSACNHGRLCANLYVSGRDVGSILINEGLAERYVCGATSCPRRGDWCGG